VRAMRVVGRVVRRSHTGCTCWLVGGQCGVGHGAQQPVLASCVHACMRVGTAHPVPPSPRVFVRGRMVAAEDPAAATAAAAAAAAAGGRVPRGVALVVLLQQRGQGRGGGGQWAVS